MKEQDNPVMIIFILFVTIIIILTCASNLSNLFLIKKESNNFCKNIGYNEMTDFEYGFNYKHSIECDYKYIYINVSEKYECVKYDKWDDCVKFKIVLKGGRLK